MTHTDLTPEQQELDARLWWTTVRPWIARMTSWPTQHHDPRETETLTTAVLHQHHTNGDHPS